MMVVAPMIRIRFLADAFVLSAALIWSSSLPAQTTDDADTLWSLRTLRSRTIPSAVGEWSRSPVDAFIQQRLSQRGFEPSPSADRRTLLRRLSFDLLGLPPTPAELDEFQADPAPDAYERLVDRLLASPHLGERWARHWMDVAHFAETHGHDQDRIRPHAWPYRDYLIRAFNDDLPYARFVQDQVAGDVLFPSEPWSLAATGFLASGPFDESSLMSIQDDTDDRRIAQYVDRDDIITTVMGSFVSLTVHCARCHDHKFDPIKQDDYYRLQAVFAGVDKADRPFDPDPSVLHARQTHQRALAELDRQPAEQILGSHVLATLPTWEQRTKAAAELWRVTTPQTATAAQGSELSLQPDGSVLSGGKKPEKDTYVFTFHVEQPTITGLRLEALTHDSLFKGGPGRQDNGNLHLSEIKVAAAPLDQPDAKQPVTIKSAKADFDQQGWTIQHAIDNQPATAWGIYPEISKPHQAVFEFAQPIRFPGGAIVTVTLEQLHGGGHLLGRPRVSFTSAASPLPLDVLTLPADIQTILATPVEDRTSDQRVVLGRHVIRDHWQQALAALPPPQMVYTANREFQPAGGLRPAAVPRPIHLLVRGDIRQKQAEMQPGTLACVSQLPSQFTLTDPQQEGQRRAALAQWLSATQNGIVWRSIVNRVWHYHFGRGIVESLNDFGVMATEPSHPELLEWLADDFRRHSGSLKRLQRQLVTSAVYRQVCDHRPLLASEDGDNKLLWRQHRRRLEAEEIRDAALVFADRLDDRMHGPSARQFVESPGIQVTPTVDYLTFDPDKAEHSRRSAYRFLFRTLPDPYHEALDCPDSSQWAPVRNESLTALQALALLHDRVIIRLSEHLAARLSADSPDLPSQLQGLYHVMFQRDPSPDDLSVIVPYAEQHRLANACRMMLNSNEFLYVE